MESNDSDNKENVNNRLYGVLVFSPVKSKENSPNENSIGDATRRIKRNQERTQHVSCKFTSFQQNMVNNRTMEICDWVNLVIEESSEHKVQQHGDIRDVAMKLFQSQRFTDIISAVKQEILNNKLKVRDDRDVLLDLSLQKDLFAILFSYDLSWLCLALDVIYDAHLSEIAASTCKSQKRVKAVKDFVIKQLFPKHTVAMLPPKLVEVNHAMRADFIVFFLSLVLLLDAGRSKCLLAVPNLFVSNSDHKSSNEVLSCFCRCFLKGEGDFVKHLAHIGYRVQFTQSYLDEVDFTVRNLATDLSDGVRLARLMDVLTNSTEFTAHLLVPAETRVQKLHNVDLVLKAVSQLLRPGEKVIEAKHIVDGNVGLTLLLLRRIQRHFDPSSAIDPAKVRQEVEAIRQNKGWRRSVDDEGAAPNLAVSVRTNKAYGSSHKYVAAETAAVANGEEAVATELLTWCQSIAEQHDVPVFNLTSCLADGRALCVLVHYYHRTILPLTSIKRTTAHLHNMEEYQTATPQKANKLYQKAINGERGNYQLLYKACKEIGDVPLKVAAFDSCRVPEEKSMIALLAYLFARLTESSEQMRVAMKLQRKFRSTALISPLIRNAVSNTTVASFLEPSVNTDCVISDVTIDEMGVTRDSGAEVVEAVAGEKVDTSGRDWENVPSLTADQEPFSSAEEDSELERVRANVAARSQRAAAAKIVAFVRHALQMKSGGHKAHSPAQRVRRLLCGLRRLAAVGRGLRVRRKSSAPVNAVYSRIRATQWAIKTNELTLDQQTSTALRALRTAKNISDPLLLKACQTLVQSTRLSQDCCEMVAQSSGPNMLFTVLRSCSRRKELHMELLRAALTVLLNVARHDHLAGEVAAASDWAESLVDLMQMFRDKKEPFALATALLVRVVKTSATAKSQCNTPVLLNRLEDILNLLKRKNTLEVRVHSVCETTKGVSVSAGVSVSPDCSDTSCSSIDSQCNQFKGQGYGSIEPITCMQHLMELLAL